MDLVIVLERTQALDVSEAESAQLILDGIADYNLEDFIVRITNTLSNPEKTATSRKAAAIQIQKCLQSGNDLESRLDYQTRWFALRATVRRLIKETVLDCLGTETISPSPTADLIAFIAGAELPNEQWPDLISDLTHNVTSPNNSVSVKEASLVTIGRLCATNYECKQTKTLLETSNEIFSSIFHGLICNSSKEVMLAAVDALRFWLRLKKDKSKHDPQIHSAVDKVFELAASDSRELKAASLKCLRKFELNYEDRKLNCLMLDAIRSEHSQIRWEGFKFWYEQCFEDKTRSLMNSKNISQTVSVPFSDVLPELLPVILKTLSIYGHVESDGNRLWLLATDSVRVLSEWCDMQTIRDALIKFINIHINDNNWKFRATAVRAFPALLCDNWIKVKPLVERTVPKLVQRAEEDENEVVRCTCAVVLAAVCVKMRDLDLLTKCAKPVVLALIQNLSCEALLVCQVCEAFADLAQQAYELSEKKDVYALSPYFELITYSLLETLYRQDSDRKSRTAVYNALKCLVQYSAKDCYGVFYKLVMVLSQRLQRIQNTTPQQSGDASNQSVNHDTESVALLRALQTLVRLMSPEELRRPTPMVVNGLTQVLTRENCQFIVRAAALETLTILIRVIDSEYLEYVENIMPLVITDLKNRKTEQVCIAAIQAVHATCKSLEEKFAIFCDHVLPILLNNLTNENTSWKIKETILLTVGDMARLIRTDIKEYLDTILAKLTMAQNQIDKNYLLDNRIYPLYNHHCYFVNAYTGLMQGLKSDRSAVNHILLFLEPQLNNIVKVITLMATNKTEYKEMDDFYLSQAILLLKKLCVTFGKSLQSTIDIDAVSELLKTGCHSDRLEIKKLSESTVNMLQQLELSKVGM